MKTITKGLVGTVAAGAVAMASVSPAYARNGHDDRIDAGDVIAGALIIGGIAAIAAAASDNDRGYDRGYDRDRRGYDDRYYGDRRGGSAREAVEQCVRAAERQASRYSYGGRADVTDIRDIDRTRDGYRVKGRIAVNTRGHDWRRGDNRYGNGWSGDYRGWNNRLSGYDSGKFTCKVRYGRVVDVDYSGIRGL
ncbi:hypothetical protein SZ64_07460 [Erythrobacter sp. SG61-1L]|uniref:hypothetical protein n=1 Tax=Erythrobacter sp. SG61-1L TaxID=1603897 RepID=UPI0006C90EE9|nr:hypothetical protein [Erythrobacter sp. SG61-1L]KPL67969.1 hypothetical protein SZ64_07460 [Erythrobacter sp. SG61-1L]